jgi:serine/threonine protein kinase
MNHFGGLGLRFGPYRVVGTIEVSPDVSLHRAIDTQSGRAVLLRVLFVRMSPQDPTGQQTIARCLAEIEQLRRIQHPHLLPLIDHGLDGRHIYMAYHDTEGHHLAQALYGMSAALPPLTRLPSLGETARLLHEVGAALEALHRADQVHGQLEPRVILIENGRTLLMDAGLLRLQKHLFQLDTTGSFSMTRYTAPEVWLADRVTPASDQYALACIAYELVTGRVPFESPAILDLMNDHLNNTPQPPYRLRPDLAIPPELTFVLWQALAKRPEDRFASVMDFVEAFAKVTQGHTSAPTTFFDV